MRLRDELEVIRRRNEEAKRFTHHYECEDDWYSCPLAEYYCGKQSDRPVEERECDCGHAEKLQRCADIDTLLSEVEQLNYEALEDR